MLSKILSKEDCAACRFCCSFRRCSLWETPIFTKENIDAINSDSRFAPVLKEFTLSSGNCDADMNYATYDLSGNYQTDDPEEEAPCPYLDSTKGCLLSPEEKPWDCKIWPLRVVSKDGGEPFVVLTPTCPSINKLDIEKVREFADDKLRHSLIEYAKAHPYLIKEYKDDFFIIL